MNSIPNITVQLVHMQGPLKGEIQELADDEIRVGRHPDCQVQFPKETVTLSRIHARIVREGNRFKLIDQSTNGTFVNGHQITESFLKDGDVLMFAEGGPKVSFLTQIGDAQTAPKPEPQQAPAPKPAPAAQAVAPPTPTPPRQMQATSQPQQPQPTPVAKPPQAPPIAMPSSPAPKEVQSPQPFQAQPSSPAASSPPVQTVKAPFAIQFGPALKSFQTLPIVIGSGAGCDFVISHPGVYERHAQIFFSQNQYWIKDMTGMNCITVGGRLVNVQAGLETDMQLSLSEQGPKFRFLGGGRLAEVEDPLPEPEPERPTSQTPSPAETPEKQEWPEKIGHKAGGLLKKFFS